MESKKTESGKAASAMREIVELIKKASKIIEQQQDSMAEAIDLIMEVYKNKKRLFVMGQGRSGLMGETFAMRLRHLNFEAYVIGDSTTPAVKPDDLVMAISGSGKTSTNITLCKIIRDKIGAKIIVITSHLDSPLAKLAVPPSIALKVPGREDAEAIKDYEKRQLVGKTSLVPLGSLFEATVLVFFDSLVARLMELTGTTEEDMRKRHAVQ